LLACFASVSADTLESVEKTLIEKYSAYKSLSATIHMKMNMGSGASGTSIGTVECLTHEGKEKVRSELTMTVKFASQVLVSKVLNIDDGEDAYMVSEVMGQKRIMRTDRSKVTGRAGGKQLFADLKRNNSLKLLPQATADGVSCYVIEATPKKPQPNAPSRMIYYFDKSKGIMVKMEGFNAGGESMVTMTLTDLKLNPKLDPARFKYIPEPGVTVMDLRMR